MGRDRRSTCRRRLGEEGERGMWEGWRVGSWLEIILSSEGICTTAVYIHWCTASN